jgi:hypothetical protein
LKIDKISNVLTQDQVQRILDNINYQISIRPKTELGTTSAETSVAADVKFYRDQGRMDLEEIVLDEDIQAVFDSIASRYNADLKLIPNGVMYARYDGSIGDNPFLGPHYDGGDCDFMLDYQLESNTNWAIGQNEVVTDMADNEALTLYPLSKLHYRPKKTFYKSDFVTALFFRYTVRSGNAPGIEKDTSDDLDRIVQDIYSNYYSGLYLK